MTIDDEQIEQGAAGAAPTAAAPTARLFIGLKLNAEIARSLLRFAEGLKDPAVRVVAVDDIHLTLVPPWAEPAIPEAIARLAPVAATCRAFVLAIQHVGYGPEPRWPRLLWADCAIADELVALQSALAAAYQHSDERPFRPHITLARLRGNGRVIARRHPLDQPLALTQWVKSVELFQSPNAGERGYKVLASASLGQPAPNA